MSLVRNHYSLVKRVFTGHTQELKKPKTTWTDLGHWTKQGQYRDIPSYIAAVCGPEFPQRAPILQGSNLPKGFQCQGHRATMRAFANIKNDERKRNESFLSTSFVSPLLCTGFAQSFGGAKPGIFALMLSFREEVLYFWVRLMYCAIYLPYYWVLPVKNQVFLNTRSR